MAVSLWAALLLAGLTGLIGFFIGSFVGWYLTPKEECDKHWWCGTNQEGVEKYLNN